MESGKHFWKFTDGNEKRLKMKEKAIVQKVKRCISKFLRDVGENVLIVYDSDADGIASAALFAKILKKLRKKIGFSTYEKLRIMNKYDSFVFLDVPYVDENVLKKIRNKKILIVDHHPLIDYKNVIYCNPRKFDKNAYIPVSCIIYEVSKDIFGKKLCWIGAIGVLGDMAIKSCGWVLKDVESVYPELLINKSEGIMNSTILGVLTKIINSSRVIKRETGAKEAAKFLYSISDYTQILNASTRKSKDLLKWYIKTEREIERILKEFEKKKIKKGNFIIFEVKSKLNLKSTIATSLSTKLKNGVLVILQKKGRVFDVSFRRGRNCRKDLSKLVEKIKDSIEGAKGGGHPTASAMKIPVRRKKEFLKLFEILK